MAGKTFGGEMRITLSSGQKIATRGTVKINPVAFEKKAAANDDGSVYATIDSKPLTAEIAFEDRGYDYRALMLATMNITLTEDFTGVQHLWTNAGFEGDPVTDRRTGEVTGLSVYSDAYQRIGA